MLALGGSVVISKDPLRELHVGLVKVEEVPATLEEIFNMSWSIKML